MYFSIRAIIFVLLGAAQAADTSANQLCGTKEECELNCENGTYHTESFKGSTYLACTLDQPMKYTLASCAQAQGEPGFHRPTSEGLRTLCESVNGQICNSFSCVFIQTQSNIENYGTQCNNIQGAYTIKNNMSYERIQSMCKQL